MSIHEPTDMVGADFDWAARLMQQRREHYARYAPVFWRPAPGIVDFHAGFLRRCSGRPGAVALRTERGFIISAASQGRCLVDDYVVQDEALWPSEGRRLLLATWRRARGPEQAVLRVVCARRDEPKRQLLIALGLEVQARWWVKELTATGPQAPHGPLAIAGVEARLVAAPPVYAPGGPVCLLGDLPAAVAAEAADQAAAAGAVLAIVQRDGDRPAPAVEPALEAAGYDNVAEWYQGCPQD